jgi:hypothetical protein
MLVAQIQDENVLYNLIHLKLILVENYGSQGFQHKFSLWINFINKILRGKFSMPPLPIWYYKELLLLLLLLFLVFYIFLSFIWLKIHKQHEMSQVPVAHTCNPSYSGGRDQEDSSSKPAQTNSTKRRYFEKPFQKQKYNFKIF